MAAVRGSAAGRSALHDAGQVQGKAHKPEHLGIAGRRVLVSRTWSGKTLDDHRAERTAFVRQLLDHAGIRPAHGVENGPYLWERPAPGETDIPPRPALLLHAVAERQRWKAEYTAAQHSAAEAPPGLCAAAPAAPHRPDDRPG